MKVFIIGITGGTGSRVARLLSSQGHTVAGLYRKEDQAGLLRSLGASGTLGDIASISEQDLAKAIAGSDAVVFSAGAGAADNDSMLEAVDYGGVSKSIAALRRAAVSRFLLVSVFPEAWRERKLGEQFERYMAAKKKAEIALVRSRLDWVIVRPSALTDDPGAGRLSLGLAEVHTEISRDDVASAIVAILQVPDFHRRILELTGGEKTIPEAMSEVRASW